MLQISRLCRMARGLWWFGWAAARWAELGQGCFRGMCVEPGKWQHLISPHRHSAPLPRPNPGLRLPTRPAPTPQLLAVLGYACVLLWQVVISVLWLLA